MAHDSNVAGVIVAALPNITKFTDNRHGPLHAGHPHGLTILDGPREAGHDGNFRLKPLYQNNLVRLLTPTLTRQHCIP
jgi:hypothetical protein